MIRVFLYLSGRCLLESLELETPRVGDELCIDGKHYKVCRVVRHMPDCPPDHVNVHLQIAEAEAVFPAGYP